MAKPDPILDLIFKKYPALRKLGKVALKADSTFTSAKTGMGDIEYFSPTQDTIRYDGGFNYGHPSLGSHGVVYNPQTNDEQSIMLDLLHGLPSSDKTYAGKRKQFAKALFGSKFGNDFEREWETFDKETGGKNDGKEQFKDNWIDGQIRALMFQGSDEEFEKHRYFKGEREQKFTDPLIKNTFTDLQNYLTADTYAEGGEAKPPKQQIPKYKLDKLNREFNDSMSLAYYTNELKTLAKEYDLAPIVEDEFYKNLLITSKQIKPSSFTTVKDIKGQTYKIPVFDEPTSDPSTAFSATMSPFNKIDPAVGRDEISRLLGGGLNGLFQLYGKDTNNYNSVMNQGAYPQQKAMGGEASSDPLPPFFPQLAAYFAKKKHPNLNPNKNILGMFEIQGGIVEDLKQLTGLSEKTIANRLKNGNTEELYKVLKPIYGENLGNINTENEYEALQELYKRHGDPKIVNDRDARMKFKAIGTFNPYTNTINAPDFYTAITELGHKVQDNRDGHIMPLIKGWLKDPFITKKGWENTYNNPETFEGEAHGPITDDLIKQYGYLLDSIGSSNYNEKLAELQKQQRVRGNQYKQWESINNSTGPAAAIKDLFKKQEGGFTYNDRLREYFGKRKTNFNPQQVSDGGSVDPVLGIIGKLAAYKEVLRKRFAENIDPYGYDNKLNRLYSAVIKNEKDPMRLENEQVANTVVDSISDRAYAPYRRRLDAFSLYNNLPQKYNSLTPSDYQPSLSKDKNKKYYKLDSKEMAYVLRNVDLPLGENKVRTESMDGVMGNFTVGRGVDEKGEYTSYYDKWDLAPMDLGTPFEIYDRIYDKDRKKEGSKFPDGGPVDPPKGGGSAWGTKTSMEQAMDLLKAGFKSALGQETGTIFDQLPLPSNELGMISRIGGVSKAGNFLKSLFGKKENVPHELEAAREHFGKGFKPDWTKLGGNNPYSISKHGANVRGRDVLLVKDETTGAIQPFYRRTGMGNRAQDGAENLSTTGTWVPYNGHGEYQGIEGWFMKPGLNRAGDNPIHQQMSNMLNKVYGIGEEGAMNFLNDSELNRLPNIMNPSAANSVFRAYGFEPTHYANQLGIRAHQTGGPIVAPFVKMLSLFGKKPADPIQQNFVVPSNSNVSVLGNSNAAKPPYFIPTGDGNFARQARTFGDAGMLEMNKMWESKVESSEPFKLYSLNEKGVPLTEGHLRGAKIPNSLIQDVKTVGARYGVDPMDLLAVAGAESTFGYGPFGGVRVADNKISDDDLFTYNDFTTKPPKTFEEFAFDQGRNILHSKDFNGHYFEVPESEHEGIYNDFELKKKYTQYLSKLKTEPRQKSVLDLVAKRIAEKGIGNINPGDSTYVERVQQYKEMLKNNKTPIKFQQGGYASGDPLNFMFPSSGLVPSYAQDGLSGYFEDPLMLPHAGGGGFFGKVWKGIKQGVGGVGKAIGQGFGAAGDQLLSFAGAPNVIQNSAYDKYAPQFLQKLNSGIGSLATGVLGAVIPGAGLGLAALQGFGNRSQGQQGGFGGQQMDFSSMFGGGQPDTQQYNVGSLLQGLMGGGNSFPANSGQNNPFGPLMANLQGRGGFGGINPWGTPGFNPQPRMYEDGGEVQQGPAMIPIQTEKGEVFVHLDGSITPVNAKKTHKQMDDDEVTDVVPEGTYVTSNDKKIRMTLKQAEEIVMGLKALPYEEFKKGVLPEEQLFSEIFGNTTKKMTPAEMTQKILRKFPTMDRSSTWNKNDIFTEITNKENMNNRLPWLEQVIQFNESRRGKTPKTQTFKHGGTVRMEGVRHLPKGGSVAKFGPGDWVSTAASALPFFMDLFGANKGKSNIDPIARNMILGSAPLYSAGLNANINSQNNQLGQAIQDFTGLGQNLNNFAGAQAGANIAGRALQQTDFQRFDPRLQDQRLANFQTRTPNAVIDALSTPQYDLNALAGTLGPRAFGNFTSQMLNSENQTRNNAIVNQFNADRGLGMNVLGQRNTLDSFSQQFNIGQGEKQQTARNAQTAGIFGDVSSYFGRLGDIQSQILPITTQFALQKAQLAGQKQMGTAQNLMNTGSIYAQLGQQGQGGGQQQQQQMKQTGNYDFLKNIILQNQQQTQQQIGTIGQNRLNTNRNAFDLYNPYQYPQQLSPMPQITPRNSWDPYFGG